MPLGGYRGAELHTRPHTVSRPQQQSAQLTTARRTTAPEY